MNTLSGTRWSSVGLLAISLWLGLGSFAHASVDVRFTDYFGTNMVLQKSYKTTLYGTYTQSGVTASAPNPTITLTFYQISQGGIPALILTKRAEVGSDGTWTTSFNASQWSSSLSYNVVLNATATTGTAPRSASVTLTNVRVGEVWFCGGQSNMKFWVVKSDVNQKLLEDDRGTDAGLRFMSVHYAEDEATSDWNWLTTNLSTGYTTARYASALCVAFGLELRRHFKASSEDIPVGLIMSSRGSSIERWISQNDNPTITVEDPSKPYGDLYSHMVQPLQRMQIRGVVWCHGESNIAYPLPNPVATPPLNTVAPAAIGYLSKLEILIESWRKQWGQSSMPFVIVQLGSFGASPLRSESYTIPALREAQRVVANYTPNVALATAFDRGDWSAADDGAEETGQVHSRFKFDVGYRAAWAAMSLAPYRKADAFLMLPKTASEGPHVVKVERATQGTSKGMRITFDRNVKRGDMTETTPVLTGVEGFELCCDAAGRFVRATTTIQNHNQLFLTATAVSGTPSSVRYGWYGFMKNGKYPDYNPTSAVFLKADLQDENGFPLFPFSRHPEHWFTDRLTEGGAAPAKARYTGNPKDVYQTRGRIMSLTSPSGPSSQWSVKGWACATNHRGGIRVTAVYDGNVIGTVWNAREASTEVTQCLTGEDLHGFSLTFDASAVGGAKSIDALGDKLQFLAHSPFGYDRIVLK